MPTMFLTTTEAAKVLGLSDQTIVKRCKEGVFDYIRVGRQFLIDKQSFEEKIGKKLPEGEEGANQ